VLSCYLYRRRIGAYLDGALDDRQARTVAMHLSGCHHCSAEADVFRRLKLTLATAPKPADPDWVGFWPGVVRGIQDARVPRAEPRRWAAWLRPRWAYGSALAAALLVSVGVWQLIPSRMQPETPVIVRSADTGAPDATVMVYSTPERDLTVVWVFGLDENGARR
jgi:anti-sigma factor RsiW